MSNLSEHRSVSNLLSASTIITKGLDTCDEEDMAHPMDCL